MAFETTSASQSVVAPKELLLVLSVLNEKQKLKHEKQKEHAMQQQPQHLYHHRQHHDQQQHHKEQQIQQSETQGEQKQSEQHMELSQIELVYRAEGNANLVLALPQYKKVLRLPKIHKQHEEESQYQETQYNQKYSQHPYLAQAQQKRQNESKKQQPYTISKTGRQQNETNAVGILTMDHYVAYISFIRCLVGNEFVFEAEIVSVPNPNDSHWINEHIKPYRPANRLDKEFGGHYGLLLPDATQLPAEFDIYFPNLQRKTQSTAERTTTTNSVSSSRVIYLENNIFGSDTFAIEIKPKQGWLLPNDVNNLFDTNPRIKQTARTTQPPRSLSEPKKVASKTAARRTILTTATQAEEELKSSTDIQCNTSTQNKPSQTIIPAATKTTTCRYKTLQPTTPLTATTTKSTTMTCSCRYSSSVASINKNTRDDKISHSVYDTVDTRCRYCCMQFLKIKQQKICKRSQYCPLDLFSGDTVKMLFAIQSLFEYPQNNLRIFQNSELIFDDQIGRSSNIEDLFSSDKLQLIKHLLVTCLLREYVGRDKTSNEEKKHNKSVTKNEVEEKKELHGNSASVAKNNMGDHDRSGYGKSAGRNPCVVDSPPHSSVTSSERQKLNTMPKAEPATVSTVTETELTKVKSTLTLAEPIFTLDATSMATSDYKPHCLEQISKAEVTCLPKSCVLQKVLHLQSLAKIHLQSMLASEYADKKEKTYHIVQKLIEKFANTNNELTLCQLSPEEQYILAATAMDCSIMITFCEIENVVGDEVKKPESSTVNPYVVSVFGKTFLTKVTLLDLDPKPDAHFNKYILQIQQMFDAINEFYSLARV